MAAAAVIAGAALSSAAKSSASKKASKAAARTRRRATRAASPERFQAYMGTYEPYIKRLMEPQRVKMSDATAMGEQAMNRATDANAARYGLMGSGAHLEQRRANSMWRQGANTENTREMYLEALKQSMGLAERAQDRKISAILGSPNVPRQSFANEFMGQIGGLLQRGGSGYASGGGR